MRDILLSGEDQVAYSNTKVEPATRLRNMTVVDSCARRVQGWYLFSNT